MPMTHNVFIRADAGPALGLGHFSRCGAIAHALEIYSDAQVFLLTRPDSQPYISSFFPASIRVMDLPETGALATDTITLLHRQQTDSSVILLDHYDDLKEWEQAFTRLKVPVVVIDDLYAAQSADWIVHPVPRLGGALQTDELTSRISGPAYLPLSHAFANFREHHDLIRTGLRRVLICFGGSDPTGETMKALRAIAPMRELTIEVVIGPGCAVPRDELHVYQRQAHISVHHSLDPGALAELMGCADLALGGGGVMQWERMCLGLPSIVIMNAENQRNQIEWMNEQSVMRYLGRHDQVTEKDIAEAVRYFIERKGELTRLSRNCAALVDGKGAIRLAAILRATGFTVRPVSIADIASLYEWRTDESNWQSNWSDAERPSLEDHATWVRRKLSDAACHFFVVQNAECPIGVVRFDIDPHGQDAALSIYLVPEQQRKKLGLAVYTAAELEIRRSASGLRSITSRIHSENAASLSLHRNAGFSVTIHPDKPEWYVAKKEL